MRLIQGGYTMIDQNIDNAGNIDKSYYINASIDIIQREAQQRNIDLNKLKANQLKALLRACYHSLYEPPKNLFTNQKCNITYNEKNIQALLDVYIEICETFFCIPSLFGFERYSGITEETTQKYLTRSKLELLKLRKDYIQNELSNTPLGITVLANHDQDTGLLYNRQNILEREAVKHSLSKNDLLKLPENQQAQGIEGN